MKYFYPCSPANRLDINCVQFDELDNDTDYVSEDKRNGWRCEAYNNDELILWTRKRTIIPDALPTLRKKLREMLTDATVVDGELMEKRTKEIKELFYAFDILFYKGEPVYRLPWTERRSLLEKVIQPIPGLIELSSPVFKRKRKHYYKSIQNGNEGIVLKKINSVYPIGLVKSIDNPYWIKVKAPEKHQYAN